MKKKTFVTVITMLLLTFCLTLSGCSERVNLPNTSIALGMSLNEDGSISQSIEFSMQTKYMRQLNIKESHIQEIQKNMLASVTALRNEFYLSLLVTYSTSPDPNFKIGDAVNVSEVMYSQEYDVVHFSIDFSSLASWQYYHGTTGGQEGEKEEGIKFFSKSSSQGINPFAAKFVEKGGKEITVGERYLNIYKAVFNLTLSNEVCYKLETPSFVYDYATPFSSLRSNADLKIQSGGLYHNIWINNLESLPSSVITLSQTTIYAGWWYLSLLIAVIAVLAICLIVYKIRNR